MTNKNKPSHGEKRVIETVRKEAQFGKELREVFKELSQEFGEKILQRFGTEGVEILKKYAPNLEGLNFDRIAEFIKKRIASKRASSQNNSKHHEFNQSRPTTSRPPRNKTPAFTPPSKNPEKQIIALSLLGEAINKYGTDIEQLPDILSSALSTWVGDIQEWQKNSLSQKLEKMDHVEDNDSVILVYTIPAHQEKIKPTRADIRIFLLDYLPTVRNKEEKATIYKEPIVNVTEYGFKND